MRRTVHHIHQGRRSFLRSRRSSSSRPSRRRCLSIRRMYRRSRLSRTAFLHTQGCTRSFLRRRCLDLRRRCHTRSSLDSHRLRTGVPRSWTRSTHHQSRTLQGHSLRRRLRSHRFHRPWRHSLARSSFRHHRRPLGRRSPRSPPRLCPTHTPCLRRGRAGGSAARPAARRR